MQRPAFDAPASEWIVYADSLQETGDPRGELISLVHGADAETRDRYVHQHADVLLGPAAKAFRKRAYRLTWRHCFIDKAEVLVTSEDHGEHAVRALLEAPVASELSEIAIVGVTENRKAVDLTAAIKGLAAAPLPPRCTSLAIVDERATRSRMQVAREYGVDENLVTFESLAPIRALPFEHVRFELADAEELDFSAFDGSRLRTFTLRALRTLRDSWNGPSQVSQALVLSSWDRLEALELRLAETFQANVPVEIDPYVPVYSETADDDDPYGEVEDLDTWDGNGVDYQVLERMFAKLAKSPLRRLALTSFASADSLFAVLGRTGWAPTLRVLDLSDSELHERHVEWLLAHAQWLAPLTQLVLARTSLEPHTVKALAGLGPEIVHSHEATAPAYRYVVGME